MKRERGGRMQRGRREAATLLGRGVTTKTSKRLPRETQGKKL